MTPESLSCPYCNSLVILPRLPEAHQQIRCPRCQEVFPYRGQAGIAGPEHFTPASDPAEGTLPDANGQPGSKGQRLTNWALARVVLAVMGLTAGIALIFAWSTTDSRRQRDRSGPTYGQVPVVAPAKLAGLGYLPSD